MKKFRSILPLFVIFCMILQTTVFAKAPNSFEANRIVIGTHEISAIDTQKLFNAVRTIAEGEENHYYFSIMGVDEDFNDKLYWVDLLAEDPTAELIGSDLPSDFKITHLDGEPVGDLSEVSTIKVKPAFEGVISMEGTTLKVPELSSADFIKYAIEATDGSKQTYAVDLTAKTLVVTPEKTGATTATYTIEFIKGGGGGTTDAALEKALLQETIDVANIIYVASIESAPADKLIAFKTTIDTAKKEVNKDLDAAGYKTANTNLVNAINAFLVPEGMYTITIDSNIQNGTVKADKPMAKKDDVITLTVTPASGYQLKAGSLKANDSVITDNTFTMPEANVTITAEFEKVAEATLSSIAVTKQPTKTEYNIGDTLDTTGMIVTGTYSDGTTKDVTSSATVSGFDSTTTGLKTLTVTVDGKTAIFVINVINKDLPFAEKPTITTNLSTTDATYYVGDNVVLTVVAEVKDGGALSYQWYKGDTAITGANSSTYKVDTTEASEAIYYVQITNTKTGTNLSYVDSNKLKVTVKVKEAEKLTVTFSSNDGGTVEAHVYESGKDEAVVTTSPTQVASGSKVVFLAKPTTENVLKIWNDNSKEITYTIEKLTANTTVTATFIAKDKTPLEQAISGANVYATQISDGVILVEPNGTTVDKVENGKKFVTEIERDALITGIGLAEKLCAEVDSVVIETEKQITDATTALDKITDAFKKAIKTGTGTQKPIETVEINFGANNSSMGAVEAYVYENASSTVHTKVYTESPINVASGSKVLFLAKPNSGYELENWNGTETGNTYTISNVTSDATVTANFKAKGTTNVPVESVTVSPATVSIVSGATTTLTATVTPDNATNQNVTWSSSDSAIATVSGGVVTALSAGTATITATTVDGNKKATSSVTVTDSTTDKVTITYSSVENGTVTGKVYYTEDPEDTGITLSSGALIAKGGRVELVAEPISSDFVFASYTVNSGEATTAGETNVIKIAKVESDTAIVVTFNNKNVSNLEAAILSGEALSASLVVATSAEEVPVSQKWVIQSVMDILTTQIDLAKELVTKSTTQVQITNGTENLNSVIKSTSDLAQKGTKPVSTNKYTVTGGVYGDNTSNPLSDAIVKVASVAGEVYNTNSKGLYTITDVTNGTYNLGISKDGYESKTVDLTVSGSTVTVSGATAEIDGNKINVSNIILAKELRNEPLKATVTSVVYGNTTLTDAEKISVATSVYGTVSDATYTENGAKVNVTFKVNATDIISNVVVTGKGSNGDTQITPSISTTSTESSIYTFTVNDIVLSDLLGENYRFEVEFTTKEENSPIVKYCVQFEKNSN